MYANCFGGRSEMATLLSLNMTHCCSACDDDNVDDEFGVCDDSVSDGKVFFK